MAFINQKLCVAFFFVTIVVGVFQVVASRVINDQTSLMAEKHQQWMASHGRVYKDEAERSKRFKIFSENVKRIEELNSLNRGFTLGLTAFADLTNDEFRASHTGYIDNSSFKQNMSKLSGKSKSIYRYENFSASSPTMDWRMQGAVTPIKDQGACGCCWAFSTVAATESLNMLKTGTLTQLSEQELIDCNTKSMGCNGGNMDDAFAFITNNGGLASEDAYPYTTSQGTCNQQQASINAASISGFENVPSNDEDALLNAVANQPISVAIEGGGYDFQHYQEGVFKGNCGNNLDHAVTIIGYGVTDDGDEYWLVKNSWGTQWGEQGYMRIQRDVAGLSQGMCGIAMQPSYPTA